MERKNVFAVKGNPLTLIGPDLKAGDKAPDFSVLDNASNPVTLQSSAGKVRLFSVVPSLETSVCDIQTVTFNRRAAETLGRHQALHRLGRPPARASPLLCRQSR